MRKGNRMKAKVELLEILAEADKDVRNGRVAPIHDTFNNLRSILKERECSNEEYVGCDRMWLDYMGYNKKLEDS